MNTTTIFAVIGVPINTVIIESKEYDGKTIPEYQAIQFMQTLKNGKISLIDVKDPNSLPIKYGEKVSLEISFSTFGKDFYYTAHSIIEDNYSTKELEELLKQSKLLDKQLAESN